MDSRDSCGWTPLAWAVGVAQRSEWQDLPVENRELPFQTSLEVTSLEMKRSDSFEEVFFCFGDLKFVCYVGCNKGTIFFWVFGSPVSFLGATVRCPESKYPPWNFFP